MFVAAQGIHNLISVFTGNVCPYVAKLGNSVSSCQLCADEYAVVMVGFDGDDASQVGSVGVDGEGVNQYFYTPHMSGALVKTGKLIRQPTAALPQTDNHQLHMRSLTLTLQRNEKGETFERWQSIQ
jgi:hypothetical protein